MAAWDNGLAQLRNLWTQLGLGQKIVLLGSTLGAIAGIFALTAWFAAAEYSLLFGGLSPEDASSIVETLKTEKIPYQLTDGGKAVRVPADKVYDTRIMLASRGVPQGGEVGYEIFDKFSFGMTNFAQRINYLRALEGELTRTIRRMGPVEGARVHLVMPEKRLFEEKAQAPTASVVLRFKAGGALTPKQVQGIVFLVSSSVEGMKAENVSVIDAAGNILHKGKEDEEGAALAGNQFELKTGFEKETERRVRDMLERVLGPGSAVVRVSADFDFDKLEKTSETYDPEGSVVRSESRSTESSQGQGFGGASGIPGVASNVGPAAEQSKAAGQAGPGSKSDKESETINYEVSRTVTRTVKSPAKLLRMSVAVVVDGSYKEPAVKGQEREFVPRTAEELAKIKALVEKASGLDEKRGDMVEVTSIPFKPMEIPEAVEVGVDRTIYVMAIKYGVGLIAAVLFLLFFVRPFMRFLAEGPSPVSIQALQRKGGAAAGAGLPPIPTLDQLERVMESDTPETATEYKLEEKTPEETLKRESLKTRILDIVGKEPEVAANLVKSWMNEPE